MFHVSHKLHLRLLVCIFYYDSSQSSYDLLSPPALLREVPGQETAAVQPNPLVKRITYIGMSHEYLCP